MNLPLGKPKRIWLVAISCLVAFALCVGLAWLSWPGPDTLVIDDTGHRLELTGCGGAGSSIPPGDVEMLNPGSRVVVPSAEFERVNVCDVYFAEKPNDGSKPDACLPLPLHKAEVIRVSQRLRPYPFHAYTTPCDELMKSY